MPTEVTRQDATERGRALARDIVLLANRQAWAVGDPLREEALAEHFSVSRTPINRALRHLATLGIAEHLPRRGFFLRTAAIDALPIIGNALDGDDVYLRLARDALDWGNGTSLTISDVSTAYGETRSQVERAIERAAVEGWLEKGAGYKWIVRLGISTAEDYARFYRFREVVEPAALLEPNYKVDASELESLLALQIRIAAGDFQTLSAVDLFEINTDLHESVVAWSGNLFYLDALKRSNAARRVLEYTKVLETKRIDTFASEHIAILKRLKTGHNEKAATLIRAHLRTARNLKAPELP